jgi:membrane protein DedA with SNARE-associated domain
VWAVLVSVVAYKFGEAAAEAINKYGLYGALAVVVTAAILFVAFRFWKKRMLENPRT